MTCWIIHWVFAEEQMEGQAHTQTCSLADFFAPVHSCIYLYTQVYVLKYLWKYARLRMRAHTHTRVCFQPPLSRDAPPSVSAAFGTRGASCQRHPCFLIPPSSRLTIWTEKKITRYFYLHPSSLSILISFCSVTTSLLMYHCGPCVDLASVEPSWCSCAFGQSC